MTKGTYDPLRRRSKVGPSQIPAPAGFGAGLAAPPGGAAGFPPGGTLPIGGAMTWGGGGRGAAIGCGGGPP